MRSAWILDEDPFAVVVDCGSRESRLYMYKYDRGKEKWLVVEPDKTNAGEFTTDLKIADALVSRTKTSHEIANSLSEFIFLSQPYIPEASRESIHVWVLQTAAVRRQYVAFQNHLTRFLADEKDRKTPGMHVTMREPPSKINIFERGIKVETLLKENLGKKRYILENFTVFSGGEEAVFSWVAVNDVIGNPQVTVGIIEFGRTSVQICLEVREINIDSYFPIYKKGHLISLHASSFNAFGMEEIDGRRLLALRFHQVAVQSEFPDPCMQNGFNDSIDTELSALPGTVFGKYDYKDCMKLIRTIDSMECAYPPCSARAIWVPQVVENAYYLRGYPGKLAEGLGLKPNTDFSNGQFKTHVKKFCALEKKEAIKLLPDAKGLKHMCFRSLWVAHFLEDIGFHDEDVRFRFLDSNAASLAYGSLVYNTIDMVSWLPPLDVKHQDPDNILIRFAVPMAVMNVVLVIVTLICCCVNSR